MRNRRRPSPASLLALGACLSLVGCISEQDPADASAPAVDRGPPVRDMHVDPPPDMDPVVDAAPTVADASPDGPSIAACANGVDDDGDGLVDLSDPGCVDTMGDDERDPDPPPVCANGRDDDDDGLVDYPADPDCRSAGWGSEGAVCGDERRVTPLGVGTPVEVVLSRGQPIAGASCGAEGVGLEAIARIEVPESGLLRVEGRPADEARLFARSACRDRQAELACVVAGGGALEVPVAAGDELYVFAQPVAGVLPRPITLEARLLPRADLCRNGLDDDGDGLIDQADPGCAGPDDPDEADPPVLPACGNGIDDDGDGAIDWPDDDGCPAAGGDSEGQRAGAVCAGGEVVEVGLGAHRFEFDLDSSDPGVTDGRCGGNGNEAMVRLRLDRPASLEARVTSPEVGVIASYFRSDCGDPATETLCDAASLQRVMSLPRLEAGSYALFVDHDVGFARRTDRVTVELVLEPLPLRACENGEDDDGDGLIDAADPGCFAAADRDEVDPPVPPACADGVDNDRDGVIDFPDDRSCRAAGSAAEGVGCPGGGPFVPVGDAGGRFTVDPRPFDPGTAIARCGGDRGAEAIFVLDLTTAADVEVFAEGSRAFMRVDCAEARTERACSDDGVLRLETLEAGRYYVFVEPGDRAVEVEFRVDSLIRACNDGLDNDGDGAIDLADRGCTTGLDRSEDDPPEVPACADGLDNDGDGAVDWPADPECRAAGDPEEDRVCDPALAVFEFGPDGGVVDLPEGGAAVTTICGDPNPALEVAVSVTVDERSRIRASASGRVPVRVGARRDCFDPESEFECFDAFGGALSVDVEAGTTWLIAASQFAGAQLRVEVESRVRACNNEVDDDGDGRIDLADPGCQQGLDDDEVDPPEAPQCSDGIDNDDDGAIDWPDDLQCLAAGTADEAINCPPFDDVVVVPPEGGVFETDTNGRPDEFQAPCAGNAQGGESVLAVVLAEPTRVVIEVIEADYDTALFVRQSCLEGDVIACDDDGGDALLSRIERVFDAGIWYVFVDGFGQGRGRGRVSVDFQ